MELFGYFNPELKVELNESNYMARSYRVPIEVCAAVQFDQTHILTKLTDLSTGGAFIAWPKDQNDPGSHIVICFKMGDKIIKTTAEVTWKNIGQSHLQPYGFGLKFSEACKIQGLPLKNWLYRKAG